ncbi:hypothetical protein [Streptomyces sp. NPDC093089]|uniref:hypothetical protein n=1 Tax=Streptomyces sp. NPDC093089 TaxID=3366024 RepID=UPI003816E7E8
MSTARPDGLLRQRDFRLLRTGVTTSRFGSSITGVAMPLVAVVTLDASTFWVSALASTPCLLGIRATEPPPKRPGRPAALRQDVAEGLRHTVGDPYLRVLTTCGTVTNLLLTGYQAVLTVFRVRELTSARPRWADSSRAAAWAASSEPSSPPRWPDASAPPAACSSASSPPPGSDRSSR